MPTDTTLKMIDPADLIPADLFAAEGLWEIDLAYARDDNLLLAQAVYRPDARLWLHRDLMEVVMLAAHRLRADGYTMVIYDGLRTVETQQAMLETKRVRDNPHWLEEPRLLSPPGTGGHPRGMAVDVSLKKDGGLLDMGTPFDFLAESPHPQDNPAHRDHPHLLAAIRDNRAVLDQAMMDAAKTLGTPLLPLPQEWWDFRLPHEVYEQYAPLSDADLPAQMQMSFNPPHAAVSDFPDNHFQAQKDRLLDKIFALLNRN